MPPEIVPRPGEILPLENSFQDDEKSPLESPFCLFVVVNESPKIEYCKTTTDKHSDGRAHARALRSFLMHVGAGGLGMGTFQRRRLVTKHPRLLTFVLNDLIDQGTVYENGALTFEYPQRIKSPDEGYGSHFGRSEYQTEWVTVGNPAGLIVSQVNQLLLEPSFDGTD